MPGIVHTLHGACQKYFPERGHSLHGVQDVYETGKRNYESWGKLRERRNWCMERGGLRRDRQEFAETVRCLLSSTMPQGLTSSGS